MNNSSDKKLNPLALTGPALTRRNTLVWLLPSVLVPGLAACSSAPQVADKHISLEERARAYWAATLKNDLIAAWPLEDASLDPRWTLQTYLKRGGISYEAAEVKGIKSQDGDNAVIEVELRFSLPQVRLRNQVALVPDRWRKLDGVWYHVLARNSLFEQSK